MYRVAVLCLAEEREEVSPKRSSRFPSPMLPPTMRKICRGYVPPNTDKATAWAVKVF